jgi:hypothetical protein
MKRNLIIFILLISVMCAFSQKVIFLHHSTGSGLYYEGNVAQWIANYNTNHGTNYQISERPYPDLPYQWENYPYDYWNLWINNQCNNTNPNIECMSKLAQDYDVIIFKHCFPGASIIPDDGNPSVSSNVKTTANYKLQYRALRALMDSYPTKKFIVFTLVPLHRLDTSTDEAARAKQFVDWVKTTWLTEDAKQHPNIYIFDFFSLAAEGNPSPLNGKVNCLKYEYELDHSTTNSHPNTLANQTIGPLFSQFIVNTIQNMPTNIDLSESNKLVRIFPNPASNELIIDLAGIDYSNATIEILDLQGRLFCQESCKNKSLMHIDTRTLGTGVYILRTQTGLLSLFNKFLITK